MADGKDTSGGSATAGTPPSPTDGIAMTDDELRKLGANIVKSFHEQFAQNQNHHQRLFLQVLAVLLTVLVGFGYIYIRVGAASEELNVTVDALYAFLALAMVLLSLGIALILNMALGFRRDQMVASNIRVKTKVMGISDPWDEGFFPPSFNPAKEKRRWITWMPEFHQIFFVTLFVVKVLLFFSVILNDEFRLSVVGLCRADWLITSALFAIGVSVLVDVGISCYYHCKWNQYVDDAPSRLKPKTETSNGKTETATPASK